MKKLLFVSVSSIGTLVVAESHGPKVEKASETVAKIQRGFKEYSSGRSRNDAAMTGAGVGGGGGGGIVKDPNFQMLEE